METDKVKIEGDEVTIKAGSAAEAREIAAAADRDIYKQQRGETDGAIDDFLDGAGKIADTIGRPSFEWAAWALAIVGAVVAYISWSRLTVNEDVQFLFGAVGVVIILVVKISAGRWAKAENKKDAETARVFSTIAIGGLLVNAAVAVMFQAAISADEATGTLDIDRAVETLEREERELTRSIDGMEAPRLPLDILQYDLEQALSEPARNNSNEATPLTVATVIGWETDDFCMPGGQYRSYVERYCPDIADMFRAVKVRSDFDAEVIKREAVREQISVELSKRQKSSSGLALGKEMASSGRSWILYLPGMLLMLVIEGFMVLAQYVAKRHPKGV